MATKTKIIQGLEFELSAPYEEGHTLTAVEAKVLNQVRAENIGNNLRNQVKEAIEAGDTSNLAQIVADYDAEYTFSMGGGGGGSRKLDPIEREARAIAREAIKAHLAQTGRKITKAPEGVTDEEWKAKIEENIENLAEREDILKEAKKRVAAKAKTVESTLEGLNL